VLAKLERFEWELRRRAELGPAYDRLLAPLAPAVRPIRVRSDRTSVYGQYTIRARQRERIQEELKRRGIPTAVHYPLSLHQQPAYAKAHAGQSFPASEKLAREVLSLPMSADLTQADQGRVVSAIGEALKVPA